MNANALYEAHKQLVDDLRKKVDAALKLPITYMSPRYVTSQPHGKQTPQVSVFPCAGYDLGGVAWPGVTHAPD